MPRIFHVFSEMHTYTIVKPSPGFLRLLRHASAHYPPCGAAPLLQDFRDGEGAAAAAEGAEGLALSREAVAGVWRRALEQLRAASDLPHFETVRSLDTTRPLNRILPLGFLSGKALPKSLGRSHSSCPALLCMCPLSR